MITRKCLALVVAALALWAAGAAAQAPQAPQAPFARVLSACGGATYTIGALQEATMDPTGLLCTPSGAGAGGATAANQTTQITAEQAIQAGVGVIGDAAWGGSGNGSAIAVLKALYTQLVSIVTNTAGSATSALQAGGTAGSPAGVIRSVQGVSGGTPILETPAPSSSSAIGITPVVSTALESNHVLKGSAGNLYSVYVVPTIAGYLMTFNATSAPADGAVTPIDCVPASPNVASGITFGSGPPDAYSIGITAVFSTTGCVTKTASATAFFKGRVQ